MRLLCQVSVLAVLAGAIGARPAAAQFPPDSFTNLKVLSKDIRPEQLVALMRSFTEALGVRCSTCHVGEENRPLSSYDFAADDKLMKKKARVMLHMVQHINDEHLADLPERLDPPLRVTCFTCHHGVREPRTLQDRLRAAYVAGGIDSTLAAYHSLRDEYYGSAAYDFGDEPLIDLATEADAAGHLEDAVRLAALNVEMNPESNFAKQTHAIGALALAFHQGPNAGVAQYEELREQYGNRIVGGFLVNRLGRRLIREQQFDGAIAVFKLAVAADSSSAGAYTGLGDAYAAAGNKAEAIRSYEKALELNPNDRNAAAKLKVLRGG